MYGVSSSFIFVQNKSRPLSWHRKFAYLCCSASGGSSPAEMDNSSSDWESDEEDGDSTSEEESFKITMEDLLREVLPANTILLQHGNVSNLHPDLMDYFEDAWEDQDNRGRIGWNDCGVTCSCCKEFAYPNVEFIVLEDTRYFLIFEEKIPKEVKSEDDKVDGFLQCVYCFNFYHRFGCTLSMSIQSYISCLLSRNWACPTCVPEFVPVLARKIRLVKSATDSDLLIKIFKSLNKCSNLNPIKSCCNIVANYIVTNSDLKLVYDYG